MRTAGREGGRCIHTNRGQEYSLHPSQSLDGLSIVPYTPLHWDCQFHIPMTTLGAEALSPGGGLIITSRADAISGRHEGCHGYWYVCSRRGVGVMKVGKGG